MNIWDNQSKSEALKACVKKLKKVKELQSFQKVKQKKDLWA
jgi:hypothetical protein